LCALLRVHMHGTADLPRRPQGAQAQQQDRTCTPVGTCSAACRSCPASASSSRPWLGTPCPAAEATCKGWCLCCGKGRSVAARPKTTRGLRRHRWSGRQVREGAAGVQRMLCVLSVNSRMRRAAAQACAGRAAPGEPPQRQCPHHPARGALHGLPSVRTLQAATCAAPRRRPAC
jgi:hypothetical protein